jgi:hypothetical protein
MVSSRMCCLVRCPPTHIEYRLLTVSGLQQGQPELYENLTKILTLEEQQIIQSVFQEADKVDAAIATSLANGGN